MLQKHAEELATLTLESKVLDEKIKGLKSLILDEMKAQKLTSFKDEFGTVSYVTRSTYKYSDEIKQLETNVKLKKVEEEETGKAQVSITEYVQMNFPKV